MRATTLATSYQVRVMVRVRVILWILYVGIGTLIRNFPDFFSWYDSQRWKVEGTRIIECLINY